MDFIVTAITSILLSLGIIKEEHKDVKFSEYRRLNQ